MNFASGHRYVVAIRNLKYAAGQTIPAPEGFRYFRDQLPGTGPFDGRRAHFESLFDRLRGPASGADLYLAWDFTVASDENIAARMLHIRNDAFASLGDTTLSDDEGQRTSPHFDVELRIPRPSRPRVRGTYTSPATCPRTASRRLLPLAPMDCRLATATGPGELRLHRPPGAGTPPAPGRALRARPLRQRSEVAASPQQLANAYDFVLCATDEIGMANGDLAARQHPHNLSNFLRSPTVSTRACSTVSSSAG